MITDTNPSDLGCYQEGNQLMCFNPSVFVNGIMFFVPLPF